MPEPMSSASLKLPKELDRALTELARRRRSSRSALLREAVESLARQEHRSVTKLAADLVGCLEGPRDLSTSHRHLRGYGE